MSLAPRAPAVSVIWLVVSVLVALGFGWAVVSVVWPVPAHRPVAARAIRLFVAFGIGYGATSCFALLFLLIRDRFSTSLRSYELIALALLAMTFWTRRRLRTARLRRSRSPLDIHAIALALAFVAVVVAALAILVIRYVRLPYGDWDAWAIWNMRARFLYRAAWDWRVAFSGDISWSHPDYPLLLPLSVVRGWIYMGGEHSLAAGILGPLFAAATVGLIAAVVARLRSSHTTACGPSITSAAISSPR